MSTVLTNGIIIPDNGSRNWGGDLANNWNIIDVNVGYMTDVKNKITTLENSVAENTANIQTNTSNISALQTSKQDVIDDLETIRTGASAGATAVQPSTLSDYVDLSSEQTISGAKTFNGGVNTALLNGKTPAYAYNATMTTVTMHVGSVLTNGGKVVSFVVPININGSPTVTFTRLRLRYNGNYLFGSTGNSDVTTSYTFTSTVINGGLNVVINFSDADTKAINNSCIISEITLKLTY